MTSDNRNVARMKVGREEWRRIESRETIFTLRNHEAPHDTVAFIFTDASTGTHLGNAIILSETTFGSWDYSPCIWGMFAKITGMTEQELKERFPVEAKAEDPSQFRMYLYEIKPASDSELLRRLCEE